MDVRIGLTFTAKEVELQLDDETDVESLKAEITEAIKAGRTFWLTDRKGSQIGIAAEKVSYIELGTPDAARRIGFGG